MVFNPLLFLTKVTLSGRENHILGGNIVYLSVILRIVYESYKIKGLDISFWHFKVNGENKYEYIEINFS